MHHPWEYRISDVKHQKYVPMNPCEILVNYKCQNQLMTRHWFWDSQFSRKPRRWFDEPGDLTLIFWWVDETSMTACYLSVEMWVRGFDPELYQHFWYCVIHGMYPKNIRKHVPLFLGAKGHVFPKIACTYSHVLIMVVLHETLSTQSFLTPSGIKLGGKIPHFLRWFSHDFPMVSTIVPSFSVDFPMIFPGFPMIFPGFPMIFPWFIGDFPCFSINFSIQVPFRSTRSEPGPFWVGQWDARSHGCGGVSTARDQ